MEETKKLIESMMQLLNIETNELSSEQNISNPLSSAANVSSESGSKENDGKRTKASLQNFYSLFNNKPVISAEDDPDPASKTAEDTSADTDSETAAGSDASMESDSCESSENSTSVKEATDIEYEFTANVVGGKLAKLFENADKEKAADEEENQSDKKNNIPKYILNAKKYQQKHNKFTCPRPRITINGIEISEEESWASVPDQYKPKCRNKQTIDPTNIQDFILNKNENKQDSNQREFYELKYKIYRYAALDKSPFMNNIPSANGNKAELERKLKCKCRQECDSYLKQVNRAIYGGTEGHPEIGSADYFQAAQNYAISGKNFLDSPKQQDKYEENIAKDILKVKAKEKTNIEAKSQKEYSADQTESPTQNYTIPGGNNATFLYDYQTQSSIYQQAATNVAQNYTLPAPMIYAQHLQDTYQYSLSTASYPMVMSRDNSHLYKYSSTNFCEQRFSRFYQQHTNRHPLLPSQQLPKATNINSMGSPMRPTTPQCFYQQYESQHVCYQGCACQYRSQQKQ